MRLWILPLLCSWLALAAPAEAYDVDRKDTVRLLRDAEFALLIEVTGVATIETAVEPEPYPGGDPILLSFQRVDFKVLKVVGGWVPRQNVDPRLPRYFLTGGRTYLNVSYTRYAKGERALVFLRESRATGFYHLHSSDEAARELFLFSQGAIDRVLAKEHAGPLSLLEALFREALADRSMRERYFKIHELARDLEGSIAQSLLVRLAELAGWRSVRETEETDDEDPPYFKRGPTFEQIQAALDPLRKDETWRPCLKEAEQVLQRLRDE